MLSSLLSLSQEAAALRQELIRAQASINAERHAHEEQALHQAALEAERAAAQEARRQVREADEVRRRHEEEAASAQREQGWWQHERDELTAEAFQRQLKTALEEKVQIDRSAPRSPPGLSPFEGSLPAWQSSSYGGPRARSPSYHPRPGDDPLEALKQATMEMGSLRRKMEASSAERVSPSHRSRGGEHALGDADEDAEEDTLGGWRGTGDGGLLAAELAEYV